MSSGRPYNKIVHLLYFRILLHHWHNDATRHHHHSRQGLHRSALGHLDEAGKVQEVRDAAEVKVDLWRGHEGHHEVREERYVLDQGSELYPESGHNYLQILAA